MEHTSQSAQVALRSVGSGLQAHTNSIREAKRMMVIMQLFLLEAQHRMGALSEESIGLIADFRKNISALSYESCGLLELIGTEVVHSSENLSHLLNTGRAEVSQSGDMSRQIMMSIEKEVRKFNSNCSKFTHKLRGTVERGVQRAANSADACAGRVGEAARDGSVFKQVKVNANVDVHAEVNAIKNCTIL